MIHIHSICITENIFCKERDCKNSSLHNDSDQCMACIGVHKLTAHSAMADRSQPRHIPNSGSGASSYATVALKLHRYLTVNAPFFFILKGFASFRNTVNRTDPMLSTCMALPICMS